MLTQIVLFGILISGSGLGSAIWKKHFEDLLPVTCSAIVLILFLCGILGFLKQGVYVVFFLSVFLWCCSFVFLIKEKTWKEFGTNFITPAFCIFTAAYIVLIYTNYGMMASAWDEFSHWADIVKAMVSIDDFGTNPEAQSMFQSYPPGMSLFQYFFEKIYILLNRGAIFSEWRLYFSYQIFFLSFLMPFLRNLTFHNLSGKKIFSMFCTAVLCCFGPMLIFHNIYIIILVDAFLGLIAGTGMAMIFVREDKDWSYDGYMLSNIAMLVLAKDAGMLFAAFMLVTYVIDNIFFRKTGRGKKLFCTFLGLFALLLPKLLWSCNIRANHAYVAFSNKVEMTELFKVILGIDKTSYRVEVAKNFFNGLVTQCLEVSVLKIRIPYIAALVILIVTCYIMYRKYQMWNIGDSKEHKMVLFLFTIEIVIYVLGLCVTYMFKFSEYEAVELASFGRYMKIILQAIVIFILLTVIHYLSNHERQKYFGICVLCVCFALLPWVMIKNVATRATVSNTVNTRIRYMPIVEQVEKIAADTGEILKINVISQESAGYDGLILRYSLRPHRVVGSESIGKPFYEDDIYTSVKNAEQWQKELQEGIDYVALYHLNDYFLETFSAVFENPEDIHENGVYRVDKDTGLLVLYVE